MTQKKSPWLVLTLGTLGLVAGYSIVVFSGDVAFASARSCPLKEKCANGGCEKHDCTTGNCDADCPGCQRNA